MVKQYIEFENNDVSLVELSSISGQSVPVRQTVLSGSIDDDGYANFLEAGTGLAVDLNATSTPVRIAFADGFGSSGAVDYIGSITADVSSAFSSLPASNTSFLYAERNSSTGTITYGSTLVPPQYGYSFDCSKNLLMDFSSSLTEDKYGNTVTILGNPTLSGGKYVGDGSGDGLKVTTITTLGPDKWCVEGKFKFDTNNTLYNLICLVCSSGYGVNLRRNTSNKLELYLSSTGSSNDITSGTLGTKSDFDTSSEYHICIEFDGSSYKVYVDGVQDISITSSSRIYSILTLFGFGIDTYSNSLSIAGTMDDLRVTIGNTRYGAAGFTPPASLTPEAYFFSIPEMKMKHGYPGNWTEKQIVFLGEAVTDTSSITSVINYALQGKFDSGQFSTTNDSTYTKNHNIGTDYIKIRVFEYGTSNKTAGDYCFYYSSVSRFKGSFISIITKTTLQLKAYYDLNDSSNSTLNRQVIAERGW